MSHAHSSMDIKQLEDIATLKADMKTVKSDLKDVKSQISRFIESADNKYATKQEMAEIKKQVSKNESRIYSIAKDVAFWSALAAITAKSLGYW